MKKQEIEAHLGRPLTPVQSTNIKTYLDRAKDDLEELLCVSLDCGNSGTNTYSSRDGMSTVFTGIFSEINEVKVDGQVVTNYYPAFWDNRNAKFYNSIVFDTAPTGDVVIDADWGFNDVPTDLKSLWAEMFALVSKKKTTQRVKSKKVEDVSVQYSDESDLDNFKRDNALTIRKYSMCNIGEFRSGDVC